VGVPVDYWVRVDLAGVREAVDAIGGVRITLPCALSYSDPEQGLQIDLPAGEQTLNGRQAEQFVRYRSGYAQADLGRMDAQKLFLAAFLRQVRTTVNLRTMTGLVSGFYGRVETNLSLEACVRLAVDALRVRDDNVRLQTLPGEALRDDADGRWYYQLNRAQTAAILGECFAGDRAWSAAQFDRQGVFLRRGSDAFEAVYHREKMETPQYTVDELNREGIRIPMTP
jgi:anionic cell wall polymer biosynthesis LytR-Cps2A-Psr (LCP) family protein